MAIKSLEELRALRASLVDKINLREKGEIADDKLVEVLVGLGTCGIASGARDTYNKLIQVLSNKELNNVKVVGVGCIGQCSMEPTVQVNIPGKEPVLFGKITENKVEELVDTVIVKGDLLEENLLIQSFNKAVL